VGREIRENARIMLADIVGTDKDPLLIAVELAADQNQPAPLRLEAALGACRFLHPTLSAAAVAHVSKPADPNSVLATIFARLSKVSPVQVIDIEHAKKAVA
jgi:hypothetical protein